MSNQYRDGNLGWQSMLYYKFINKNQYRVDDIAVKLGITADCLYRYCRGDLIMPADRIAKLIEITGDLEFLEFFCSPAGYIPVKRANGKLFDGPHEKDEIALAILNGEALKEIEKAHEDGKIDKQEYRRIHGYLVRLQQKAAELAEKIRAEVKS